MVDIRFHNLVVDVDVVRVKNLRVCEGSHERRVRRKIVGEEGIFVGGLVTTDLGIDNLLLMEHPIEEGTVKVGDSDGAGGVD